jgi:Bifunctional DNA primase/polymerase, N-terminal
VANPVLRQALACAARGVPVFPCQPGKKTPATRHGYHDATTDPARIREWFAGHPDRNLAIATGAPGPDVLDVDERGPAGNGFLALARLNAAGLLTGSSGRTRTPSGACTSTSLVLLSAAATWPPATSTSCPRAATSSSRPPRSTASRTS